MITATDLEVRAGARILLSPDGPDLRVQPGDRIGLVGRNGAGKTTTLRILAGETEPYAGSITRTGEIGYLPQDPKEGDLDVLARDRVLSARGLDVLLTDLEKQQALMAEVADDATRDRAVRRYGQEWDLQLGVKPTKHFGAAVKYADYQAQSFATDTRKLWLQLEMTL